MALSVARSVDPTFSTVKRNEKESWPEQEGEVSRRAHLPTEETRVKVVPTWSDFFGSSKSSTSNSDSNSPEIETHSS